MKEGILAEESLPAISGEKHCLSEPLACPLPLLSNPFSRESWNTTSITDRRLWAGSRMNSRRLARKSAAAFFNPVWIVLYSP